MNEDKCPKCGEGFKSLGHHWGRNPRHRPHLTPEQQEIVCGLLMGDGYIGKISTHPHMEIKMTNKEFLDFISSKLKPFSGDVKFDKSAKKSAEETVKSGLVSNADPNNYSDVYRLYISSNPDLEIFHNWYNGGTKSFPDHIPLTPTVLKMWYVCDGGIRTSSDHRSIGISMSNERNNKEKIEDMFHRVGLPRPNTWNENERDSGGYRCSAIWNVYESQVLFEYMGKPIKSFDYKFIGDYNE